MNVKKLNAQMEISIQLEKHIYFLFMDILPYPIHLTCTFNFHHIKKLYLLNRKINNIKDLVIRNYFYFNLLAIYN